jgi:hypothetical protein
MKSGSERIISNTLPNFFLKSDIAVRHSVVSLPTDSALHWQVKRFRAKKVSRPRFIFDKHDARFAVFALPPKADID